MKDKDRLAQSSFNGAVTLSLQKSFLISPSGIVNATLQWSCNFIVTEMSNLDQEQASRIQLQWSCNFIVTEIM